MYFKPISSFDEEHFIDIMTETGHNIRFKIIPKVSIDLEREENGMPFFFVDFENIYESVKKTHKKAKSVKQLKKELKNRNLLRSDIEYDHIQIGFIYSEGDPNNHRWMLNFMDVNNKHLFNFIGDNIKVNCPFTTTSWEDGIWHGRFVVYKKDIEDLIEPENGYFILKGKGDLGEQKVNPIEEDYDSLSLRYNIHENTWYAMVTKGLDVIGSFPCKNILCDVPFEGKIDKSSSKPKVTAILKKENIAGISLTLNSLIIKAK